MLHHIEVQVLLLLLVAACVGMGARRFRLPYTLALVAAGLALGGFDLPVLHDAELLLLLLLPALLFEAAFHIDLAEFRRNIAPIAVLAVPRGAARVERVRGDLVPRARTAGLGGRDLHWCTSILRITLSTASARTGALTARG
ncbi:MAG: cation:proton antiporter [Myxococcales bacterium]|nr:cation:proton antiporter [Myxococcales bacterium]